MSFDLSAANSYGRALFLAAKEQGLVAEVLADAKALLEAGEDTPRFLGVLGAPHIPKAGKADLVRKAFGGKVQPLLVNFLLLLLQKDRIEVCAHAVRHFQAAAEADQGISRGRLWSATVLTDKEKQEVQAALERRTGLKLTIDFEVDEQLVGGLVFKCGDLLIDNSLQSALHRMEERLMATKII